MAEFFFSIADTPQYFPRERSMALFTLISLDGSVLMEYRTNISLKTFGCSCVVSASTLIEKSENWTFCFFSISTTSIAEQPANPDNNNDLGPGPSFLFVSIMNPL